MATAEQEAWIANFNKDVASMIREIVVILNKQLPKDSQVRVTSYNHIDSYVMGALHLAFGAWDSFTTPSGVLSNPKLKYEVYCNGKINGKEFVLHIPVSHNDVYTKKEIERAKNSILTKILEFLQKSS